MATAIRERNGYRHHLQQQLAKLPTLRDIYNTAAKSLAEATEQVKQGDRPTNYVLRFEAELDRLRNELFEIENRTPGILLDSCQDSDIRDEWNLAKRQRMRAAAELAESRLALQAECERETHFRSVLRENRGPSELLDSGKPRNWAIVDGQLLLNDDVIPSPSAVRYQHDWKSIQAGIALAQAETIEAEQRHETLCKRVAELREQMIQSPV